jgi:hypothetical protein
MLYQSNAALCTHHSISPYLTMKKVVAPADERKLPAIVDSDIIITEVR